MKTYQFVREQTIARPQADVFAFFSDAQNLKRLTPPSMGFQILTPGDIEMGVGTIIQYALQVRLVPVRWTTAITVWKPPFEFVDVQLRGPYALWHHRHAFESLPGATRMTDTVTYALPFGWLGEAAQWLIVRRDLDAVFSFRERAIRMAFDD